MKRLLDAGADPNQRVNKKVWYTNFNFDQSGVDEAGATAFWRAAYGADVDAMKLLRVVRRRSDDSDDQAGRASGDGRRRPPRVARRLRPAADSVPAVPACRRCSRPPASATAKASPATPTVTRRAACSPRSNISSRSCGADVNARDHEGNTAVHHAASRGDTEMIRYLVSQGRRREGRQPRRADDGRHGERAGAARAAVAGDDQVPREPRREEQPQVPVLLTLG